MESSHLSPLHPSMSPTPTCRTASPSPSSSSEKSASYQTVDPLLSNLSPESTIEALTSTDAVPTKEKDTYDVLSKSISQVSPSERALGIRAALAAQRLGLWYKEVQTWDWPTQAEAQLGKGFVPPSDDMDATELLSPEPPVVDHYGSLPARLVEQYEKRIEEIKDGMESLNVEELKGHVLNAHIPSRSRPSSANSSASTPPPLSYVQLSDFTAVITATILRALPLLSRLNSILASWHARLRVLRQIPGLLHRLRRTRFELDSSRNSLSSTNSPNASDSVYSTSNFHARRGELESMVSSAGRRMDSMLDRLEGREDSLPENWIDDLEAIETDFGAWAKDAERRAAECEEARLKEEEVRRAAQNSLEKSLRESENTENPSPNPRDSVAPDVPAPMETIDEEPGCVEPTDRTHEKEESPPEEPAVTPIGVHIIPSSNDPSANPSLATSPAPSEPSPPASPDRTPAQRLYAQDKETEASPPRKQQLDSPIKLSETLQKHMRGEVSPKSAIHRRTSSASTESSTSDFPSLVSSPEVRGTRAASSNGTPLFLKTPPQFQSDYGSSRDAADKHTVQENSPLRLSDQNTPRAPVMHNRAVSLSLQRFINEGLENHHEKGDLEGRRTSTRRASVGSPINRSEVRQETRTSVRKGSSKAPPGSVQRGNQQLANSQAREPTVKAPKASGHNKEPYLRNSAQRPDPPARSSKPQLAEQQAAHSGLAARKHYRPSAQLMEEEISTDSGSDKPGSRSSTQGKRMTRPNDRMDQKVNSILSTLPAPIHLVSADQERDSSSGASTGERPGAGSRINVSAPITLTPALSRRRYSHSRTPEESSVKVYHLHRGGKSVPTRLFVRTVGEGGGRVMVRVGGGWADLGEYLREYAVHHGSRSVSETPRVEVRGLSPSPNGSPAAASNERDGARRSIISSRPASSVTVHKKRRDSNVSEMTDIRTTPAGEGLSTSPFSTIFSNRRHSVSSNGSLGATSSANDAYHRSFTASTSIPSLNSTPLGLAGPKPRSRQISMSPAGEAWVEDVLGQARRSSSLNPHKLGMPADPTPKLSKARSIGDIGSAATSTRRVALRGLGERGS